jgi:CheY-like chemotaxis protein
LNSRKILLVDDEPTIRFVLTAVLEQAGYAVDVAEDGFAALKKIQETVPDLIITDLRMPNMNGFELLSVIRHRFPELPTIAISGEFLACQFEDGTLADAFFQKANYSVPEFLAKISELLQSPVKINHKPQSSPVWRPTGDGPIMLTCTECLRSFPIDPCAGPQPYPRRTDCIFCGAELEVQLVAIGMVPAER